MRLIIVLFAIAFILMCLFSISDQLSLGPRTRGRGGKVRHHEIKKDHRRRGSILVGRPDGFLRVHKHHIHPSDKYDSTHKGANRFRPPHKRKN
ncbi:unnamed protein product [Adineta steineri]|uniref:Uncharacterized protein n=1 Tax=Adineta steineri TaxID=433720 RepID=A0A814B483_9BILA|nr:unnamed protein product [Adineta steineri]CAF0922533.1 unnamed protein product [Adineta steineri]